MRLLYYLNLFIVCCSSFMIQQASLPMKFKPLNISYDTKYKNLKLQKKQLMINNFINLKKNNNEDNIDEKTRKLNNLIVNIINNFINLKKNNEDEYDNEEKTRKINNLIVNIIYNIILYSYISYYIATHNL